MRNRKLLFLVNFFVFLFVGLILTWINIKPELNIRKGKTVIKTTKTSFYIPSLQSLKVYPFDPNSQKLQQLIENDIKDSPITFGIVVKNLTTQQQYSFNEDMEFESASLYKLPIMYTIFYKASQNKLNIEESNIQDDLNQMITVSSNDAAYDLIDNYTSWQEVSGLMTKLGLDQTNIDQDPPTTTPKDMAIFFEQLAQGDLVSFDDSVKMLDLLSKQQINDRIPALLPSDTLIAHKTGDLDDVVHDVGIVAAPDSDYVIVLMTKDSTDLDATKKQMAKISLDVYNFFKSELNHPSEIL